MLTVDQRAQRFEGGRIALMLKADRRSLTHEAVGVVEQPHKRIDDPAVTGGTQLSSHDVADFTARVTQGGKGELDGTVGPERDQRRDCLGARGRISLAGGDRGERRGQPIPFGSAEATTAARPHPNRRVRTAMLVRFREISDGGVHSRAA